MMNYTATYSNGQDAGRFPCKVQFHRSGISISYTSTEGELKNVLWEPQLLHPNMSSEGTKHQLTYGNFPYQTLQVMDEGFPAALQQLYPELKLKPNRQFAIMSVNYPLLLGALAVLIGLVALVWWVLLPYAGKKVVEAIPVEYEIELGETMYASAIQEYEVNAEAGKALTTFIHHFVDTSVYPVKVDVVKQNELNAFAMPGGHIIVYDSILRSMESYEELAGLLAHEYSHVALRHSTRNIVSQMSVTVLLSVIFGGNDALGDFVLHNAAQLKQLHYSRTLEEEADTHGFTLLREKHISPEGMITLFEKFKKIEHQAPEFFSTHPLPDTRITHLKEQLQKNNTTYKQQPHLQELFLQIKKSL